MVQPIISQYTCLCGTELFWQIIGHCLAQRWLNLVSFLSLVLSTCQEDHVVLSKAIDDFLFKGSPSQPKISQKWGKKLEGTSLCIPSIPHLFLSKKQKSCLSSYLHFLTFPPYCPDPSNSCTLTSELTFFLIPKFNIHLSFSPPTCCAI